MRLDNKKRTLQLELHANINRISDYLEAQYRELLYTILLTIPRSSRVKIQYHSLVYYQHCKRKDLTDKE
jgi:hypothetical protein